MVFPIIHWEDGEISTVDDAELPVLLPELKDYKPGDGGQSPLANATEWLQVTDKNGRKGIRETNTMPQWAGSCWYYLRYIDACNGDAFVAKELEKYWMPVDLYVGGAEHAVLHLLYSRFWHKVLFDLGLVSTDEPLQKPHRLGHGQARLPATLALRGFPETLQPGHDSRLRLRRRHWRQRPFGLRLTLAYTTR